MSIQIMFYVLCVFQWLALALRPKYASIFACLCHSFIHSAIPRINSSEMSSWREMCIFYQDKKRRKNAPLILRTEHRAIHNVNCEHGKLSAFDISAYAARRYLFVCSLSSCSLLSVFLFSVRRQCTQNINRGRFLLHIEFHLMAKITTLSKWKSKHGCDSGCVWVRPWPEICAYGLITSI